MKCISFKGNEDSAYLPTYINTYLPTCQSTTFLPTCLSTYLPTHLSVNQLPFYWPVYLLTFLPTYLPINYLSTYLSTYLQINHLPTYLPTYPRRYPPTPLQPTFTHSSSSPLTFTSRLHPPPPTSTYLPTPCLSARESTRASPVLLYLVTCFHL